MEHHWRKILLFGSNCYITRKNRDIFFLRWRLQSTHQRVHLKNTEFFFVNTFEYIFCNVQKSRHNTLHSSEIRGLRSTRCSSETLQNLLYFMYKKTQVVFFVFHFLQIYFFPYECPGLSTESRAFIREEVKFTDYNIREASTLHLVFRMRGSYGNYMLWAQSFTSLLADLRLDINSFFF